MRPGAEINQFSQLVTRENLSVSLLDQFGLEIFPFLLKDLQCLLLADYGRLKG